MDSKAAARTRRPAGNIRCDGCYRTLEPGEPFYEMKKSGAILCAKDMRETANDTVAHRGEI